MEFSFTCSILALLQPRKNWALSRTPPALVCRGLPACIPASGTINTELRAEHAGPCLISVPTMCSVAEGQIQTLWVLNSDSRKYIFMYSLLRKTLFWGDLTKWLIISNTTISWRIMYQNWIPRVTENSRNSSFQQPAFQLCFTPGIHNIDSSKNIV